MPQPIPVRKALISVSDKTGLEELARALVRHGTELYATGGTHTFLEKALGAKVQKVEALTQFPEMMDGRVKTLHPRVFGGVLARRENPKDMEEAARFEVPLFDAVVVNLYPFHEHLGEPADKQSSFVDIGGPSLIRAAAKNFSSVAVLSDPADYAAFLKELETHGGTTRDFRFRLAGRTFARTAAYDGMIAAQWGGAGTALPTRLDLVPQEALRYGENPHQRAAWCGVRSGRWNVLQGKELSFNNLLDAEAALRITTEFDVPAVAIVKHNNPCGVAAGDLDVADLFERALACDPKSAFGGIVAVNREIDGKTAETMSPVFLEVVLAAGFTPEATAVFAKKKNLRLIAWPKPELPAIDVRAALGGWLLQDADRAGRPSSLKAVTKAAPTPAHERDALFAWLVCKHVRSNAIVVAKDGVTLGIGAGQMSRVDAVGIALAKAREKGGGTLHGAVLASDAFFPFRDNIDLLKGTGIAAVIQPGGSQRDAEVIAACDELGIAMAFTGERHFRH